jgi:hypothetical protein
MAINDDIKSAFPGQDFKTGDQVSIGDQSYTMGSDGNFAQSDAGSSGTSKSDTPTTSDGTRRRS